VADGGRCGRRPSAALHDPPASAPHAATFSACRARSRSTGRPRLPRVLQLLDLVLAPAASANDATGTCSRTSSATSPRVGVFPHRPRRFTPNGRSVRDFTSRIADASWSYVIVAEARMPSAPASAVGAHEAAVPATQPIPVCTIGTEMPKRSQIRVWIVTARAPRVGDFLLAETERVDHLADPPHFVVGRQAAIRATSPRNRELEARRRDDVVDRHTRNVPSGDASALSLVAKVAPRHRLVTTR